MSKTLGALTLPEYTQITRIPVVEAAENRAVQGSLNVDRMGQKEAFEVKFNELTLSEYNAILAEYELQFSSGTFPSFVDAGNSIDAPVYIRLTNFTPRFSGKVIFDYTLRLEEA